MKRRGFSLAELLVAMVIAGVIGVALTRLVISQARFVASQDGSMRARAVGRAALAVMADELRQVAWGGVVALAPESITVRIPYAFGLACQQYGGATAVALLPPDSARYEQVLTAGYAWRDTAGTWSFVEPATKAPTSSVYCATATPLIWAATSPGGTTYFILVSPNVVATPEGAVVYLYQRVTYRIGPSAELPGRTGLWRHVAGAAVAEELVTPFDSASRFEFLVGQMMDPQTTVPVLDSLRGLRVRLIAVSEGIPPGKLAHSRFSLTSDIVFRNRER